MTGPTWTILIPTLGQRGDLFARLADRLLPQLDEHGGRARVLAWWNHGQPSLPEIRQHLVRSAGTEYVSFVDDDDLVPEYFVAEVLRALETRPDHVGFKLEYLVDGEVKEIVDHSLRHRGWGRDVNGLHRDLTHIDPIRTSIALRADFRRARRGRAEDRAWVKQVRPYARTEVYIDKVMYHYLWSQSVSAWQRPDCIQRVGERPVVEHPFFAWHSGSDRD